MRSIQRVLSGDVALATLSCVLASVLGVVTLQAWRFDLSTPLYYLGDGIQIQGYVQNIIDSGWVLNGPRLNAPFGQEYHDFPLGGETLQLLLVRLASVFSGEPASSVNIVFLLSFPLVALTGFWALRRLEVAGPVAVVGSVLFAILPFHFLHNARHLLISTYYVVPLAGFVLVSTIEGRPLFGMDGARAAGGRTSRRWLRVIGAVALAVIIASSGAYFTAFTLMLLAPAVLIGWLHVRSRTIVLSGALMGALIVLVFALVNAPSFTYWLQNGANADVPIRGALETRQHQLTPISLFMPVVGHRISFLARLADAYSVWRTGDNGEPLGTFAAIGLLLLIIVALGSVLGFAKRRRLWFRERRLAVLTFVAVAIATSGGLSTLIAIGVTAQVRAWGRMSIFIGFFSVLALTLLLTVAWRCARSRGWLAPATIGLVVIVSLAFLDQATPGLAPGKEQSNQFVADREFVERVEAWLPPGAAVYQLPYRQYPEAGPRENAIDYDHLRPYIHSQQLRFSYGGMKGREAGWQPYVYGRAPREAMPVISLAGFSAVWVDRYAYADRGQTVEQQLEAETGITATVSDDGRYAVYDVRPYAAMLTAQIDPSQRATLDTRLLTPVWLRWRSGGRPINVGADGITTRPLDADAVLSLVNPGEDGRPVTVSFIVESESPVVLVWPDGLQQAVSAGSTGPIVRTVALASGDNRLTIDVTDPPVGGRAAALIHDLFAVDPDLLALQPPD